MTVRVVSAYLTIPNHPRSEKEYRRLGNKLLANVECVGFNGSVEGTWLYRYLKERDRPVTHSVADNPAKNSLEYHMVQAEKTEFLHQASLFDLESDVFIWIDLGIFHLPGMTQDILQRFLKRVENEQAIAIPGCWDENYIYNDDYPCWRFCGGVMVVPRRHVETFNAAMKAEYIRHIEETDNVSWEVNTISRLERRTYAPLWWYKADTHDASMFENYRRSEWADDGPYYTTKRQLRGIERRLEGR